MPEGILCIDKPRDFTSFDVVAVARGITKCRKIGHGGTLDPMATGVLPLFLGKAVKATSLMPVQDKRYLATVQFGLTTDSQDITGKVLTQSHRPVTREALEAALETQRGTIQQLPPMYSAVWVDGQRLYKLAREGKEIERPTREVTVHSLTLVSFDEAARSCVLDVSCSKGTFIRTICHDVGEILGCGGVLSDLRRTETLGFTLEGCVTIPQLEDICRAGRLEEVLQPVDSAFAGYGRVFLSPKQTELFLHGVRLDPARFKHPDTHQPLRIYGEGRFLGLGRVDMEKDELVIVKMFASD